MSAWRAALRIARREARRSKGRSALVVAMIGVPMLALSFADVAVRTGQLPRSEVARRELGAADLVATVVWGGPIRQEGLYGYGSDFESAATSDTVPDPARVLPPGARVAPRTTVSPVTLEVPGRAVYGEAEQVDLLDPLADGLVRVRAGTLPRAAGETALSERAARDLRVEPGDTVTVAGRPFRVTGVVVAPSNLSAQRAFVPPAAPLPPAAAERFVSRAWAVDLPDGADAVALVPSLNRLGLLVKPRPWVLDPPSYDDGNYTDAAGIGAVVLVAGLAALEIVLLAGTAFAVGARRRRRELALVAATGGDRKDVRRVVLAGAVVLGGIAGVLGVVGGVLGVVLLRPVLGRLSGSLLGPLDLRPLELGGIVLLATGTALVAALLPARAASRFPVIAGLTGRRGEPRLRKRVPIAGLVAIGIGTALAFWAARRAFQPVRLEGDVVMYQPGNDFLLVMVGAAIAELGFVVCAPAVVSSLGRIAGRLPLSLRLAARDAARHRSRTGPAVAAVVAAVAGSVALSVYMASENEQARRAYEPFMPMGGVRIGTQLPDGTPIPAASIDAAVAVLPVRERVDTFAVASACSSEPCAAWVLELPEAYDCPPDDFACHRDAPRPGEIKAGPTGLVEWATGRRDEAATGALRAGRAVVFDGRWLRDGKVTLALVSAGQDGSRPLRTVRVPAVAFEAKPLGEAPAVVMSPETARRHGLPLLPSATFVLTERMPTRDEQAKATATLLTGGPFVEFHVERGYESKTNVELLVLALAAGFVTLAATGIATGLAAADSRPDLATLAAVGAAPRVRRRLVMAQAATVAVAGSLLGVLAGLVPAAAVVTAQADFPLVLPWPALAITVVGVPATVAAVMGLLTRSRLPLERRLA
ncbi:MAG TPA: FtsX-like permease family protein [Frankiaceae bacterium]|nr:FtsX-like permease family protein [Frankiaceae bacterium]